MAKEEPVYSRDETVAAVTSYYEFLTGIHIPPAAIKYPPKDGWSQLTPEYLAFLNKNDVVVDLIRHLPFIQRDDFYDPYEIYEKTTAVDFTGKLIQEEAASDPHDLSICEPLHDISTVPAHVLTLGTTPGDRNGHFLFLDTSRGTVTICDFQVGGRATDLSLPDDGSSEEWRSHPTYTVHDFFEMLKDKFKSFEVVATNEREVTFARRFETSTLDRLQDIYKECGWLSKEYRQEECMKLVKEVTKR